MDIRKTDSKGRLTGFEPSKHYTISGAGMRKGDYVIRKTPDDTWTCFEKVPEPAKEYVRSFGIDPWTILNNDRLNKYGYDEVELEEVEGGGIRRVQEYGATKETRRPWPEGFNWETLIELTKETS